MRRVAIVHKEKCNPIGCGGYLCIRVCPENRMGKECIVKDTDGKVAINEEECTTGVSIAVKACPYGALEVINLPEKLLEDPIHRYSKNSFELFRVPTPKKGMVIGILGRNGIGKSTALDILSNTHKPNLGKYDKKNIDQKEILDKFKRSELSRYLYELYNGQIKVAYKPQRIDLIPKIYKGKVKDLIKKVDERKISDRLIVELEVVELLERNLSDLSGGELQKIAILATMVKKANFYFFDEPASFLDVTSRIKVAKLIRELGKEASVMVAEHDLATLDFISDEIQILYGSPGAYGVVSQSKAVRRGINEYLDGYLDSENIRFRDYPINYTRTLDHKSVLKDILLLYGELKKSFDSFTLKVNEGSVRKGEVLTVMGANGLGKTTFLKILSGAQKTDRGEILKNKVAYKAQYPDSNVPGTVRQHLMSIAKTEFESGWYKQNIIEKLNLTNILDNEIKTLSGGELQKVYIAATLSFPDVKIFAFDEPTAFIDVEDRLKVAEVIKEFVTKKEVCAIVVDHDVQFIDFLSDRMLVFEGVPSKEGRVFGPLEKREGMNRVLKMLDITYRRDIHSKRPRINKPGSQLDAKQRSQDMYYED